MRTNRDQPQSRTFKIQRETRYTVHDPQKKVPSIRLTGGWLSELGFKPSMKVNVTSKEKELIIRLEE